MERVSVVVPAYNARSTIGEALRSALDQSVPADEVIVVDDGSSDGTAEYVAEAFPEVRLVRQVNAGPSAARNRGAELAGSAWLAFLDADDEWLKDKLRLQHEALARRPDIGMCSCEWVRDASRVPDAAPEGPMPERMFAFEDIVRLNRFQTSTVLVRRDLWQEVGGFRSAIDGTEDWDFWMRVSRHTDDLHIIWPLVVYRDEGASYSKNGRRVYDAMHRMLGGLGPPAGPLSARAFRRLVAWHDVRFAYAFWRRGRTSDMRDALQHGREASSLATMADVALREFLPYLAARKRRPFGR